MEISKLIDLFLYELDEELKELSSSLLSLEVKPTLSETLEDIYINIHTIKGSSTSVLNNITNKQLSIEKPIYSISVLTHRFEDFVDTLRNQEFITEKELSFLFSFVEILENLQEEIVNEGEKEWKEQVDALIASIASFLNSSSANFTTQETYIANNANTEYKNRLFFEILLSSDEDFKHGYLSLVYRDIEDEYENCTFSPTQEELLKGDDFSDITIQVISDDNIEDVKNFLSQLDNVKSVKNIPYNPPELDAENAKELSNDTNLTGSIYQTEEIVPKKSKNSAIRIEPKRIDNVLKHTSKLVILKNKLNEFLHQNDFLAGTKKRKELEGIFDDITLHVDFLQESVLEIRMTPFEQLYSRFPKDIRTLSKEFNKPVVFHTTGASTEIDKSILDDLYEPFMHIIRNSIVHGIETLEERKAKGKSPSGTISIVAKPDKNRVVIKISDDGKGLDIDTLKQTALDKKMLTYDAISKLSKEEAFELIFKPGFSSTKQVNKYSGRGVGMEAFRKKIEDLKGSFTIESEKDIGTTITVYLPLTTAIIDGMITKINGEFFTFPIAQVEEVINIKESEIRSSSEQDFIFLRDKEIPIIYANRFFVLGENSKPTSHFRKIMILRSHSYLVGFTIDEYLGQQSVVVKNLHPFIQSAKGLSNCHVLGDGSISLIVDSSDLLPHIMGNNQE